MLQVAFEAPPRPQLVVRSPPEPENILRGTTYLLRLAPTSHMLPMRAGLLAPSKEHGGVRSIRQEPGPATYGEGGAV